MNSWFADGTFRRIFKNASLLLTGRATTGLIGLGVLSLSARGLGVHQFGVLVLVQTYVQVVTALATFQSWQAVIRYGAISLERNDTQGFQALLKFASMLDLIGIAAGAAVGWFAAPVVGPLVGWSPEVIAAAQPYSLLVLFSITATPTGILRLFDRFDLLAAQSVVTPVLRLIGVAIAASLHAPLSAYLVAWFVAGAIGGVVLMVLGWREAGRRGKFAGLDLSLADITRAHPGIGRFAVFSSLHAALQTIGAQVGVFIVGMVAGPAAAGLFKVARDVATALSRPADMLNQSIYPEFARLGSRGEWRDFARLTLRGAAVAAAAAAVIVTVAIIAGAPFLRFFFGPAFEDAYLALVLMVAAAGLTITGFPMDPALYAMGRPSIPLRVNMVATLAIYLPLLVVLTQRFSPTGAGAATLIAAVCSFVAMTVATVSQMRSVAKRALRNAPTSNFHSA